MLILISIISCILQFSSSVFAGQEFSIFPDSICDLSTAAWTSWFSTQNPLTNNGNDIEDLSIIRQLSSEADWCKSVFNVEYSIIETSNNRSASYQTFVNHNGVFCTGSGASRCPNYKVRFCCSFVRNYQARAAQCGQTFQEPYLHSSARIVNGLQSKPHSFPWAVSLQYKGVHDCGGVIIDQWHILTAAHCLDYSNDLPNYFVRVGAHDRSSSGQLIPTAQLIIAPNYDESHSANDIGIIRLAVPLTFSNEIQPICLLEKITAPPLDSTVYVAGWGNTKYQVWTSSSPVLLQARLRIISDCSMYPTFDRQKQICVTSNGPAGKDHGSCQGDSGGGLFYFDSGRWYAAGVVSYASFCGRPMYPTVYTKISAYINWIRSVTRL